MADQICDVKFQLCKPKASRLKFTLTCDCVAKASQKQSVNEQYENIPGEWSCSQSHVKKK